MSLLGFACGKKPLTGLAAKAKYAGLSLDLGAHKMESTSWSRFGGERPKMSQWAALSDLLGSKKILCTILP